MAAIAFLTTFFIAATFTLAVVCKDTNSKRQMKEIFKNSTHF